MPTIRSYRPDDREALYDICIRTGDVGRDATGLYADPRILPDIFVGPYLALRPELAFVLVDGADRPVGFILGAADTAAYVADYRSTWLPTVAGRYPEGGGAGPDARRAEELHHPEWMWDEDLADYPAHLHINLLPAAQGHGGGRALVDTYLAALRAAGVTGVHLGMSAANAGAKAFYDRLGFRLASVSPDGNGLRLVRDTAQ